MTSQTETAAAVAARRIKFYAFFPGMRAPQRADRAAMGSLPTRAFRFCEPVTVASGFGYYIFPPISFSLMWDGTEVRWYYEGAPDWMPFRAAVLPGFNEHFEASVPAEIRGWAPPFLGALQEPGLIQMWTGLFARTAPGWSLRVGPCANIPRRQAAEHFEGIIETDRWFGPLITNFRLTKTDHPILFEADVPILQVQAIPRIALDEAGQNDVEIVPGMEALAPEDWDDFYDTVVRPHVVEKRPRGEYAAAARRRRKGEDSEPANV